MLKVGYSDNLFFEWLLEILYFPIWWYSFGLLLVLRYAQRFLKRREMSVGFLLWLKNIFVPMYGQGDFVGRLISFVIRSVQVVIRGLVMMVFLTMAIGFVALWLMMPVITIFGITHNLNAQPIQ